MKCRVHIRCEKQDLMVNLAYVVQANSVDEAKVRARTMAQQHYPEFEVFKVYHVEALPEK